MSHPCVEVQQDEYVYACEAYMGWCPHCDDFTRDGTEPDAEGYRCPVCDNRDVIGAEQALLNGWITIGE